MAGHDRDIAPWRFTNFSRSIRHFERQHSLSKFLQLPSTGSLRVKRRVRPMHSATFARSAGFHSPEVPPYLTRAASSLRMQPWRLRGSRPNSAYTTRKRDVVDLGGGDVGGLAGGPLGAITQ